MTTLFNYVSIQKVYTESVIRQSESRLTSMASLPTNTETDRLYRKSFSGLPVTTITFKTVWTQSQLLYNTSLLGLFIC